MLSCNINKVVTRYSTFKLVNPDDMQNCKKETNKEFVAGIRDIPIILLLMELSLIAYVHINLNLISFSHMPEIHVLLPEII